jgi:NDP-sugar pyrophosphorylase family protein
MKTLILAAGKGTRTKGLTKNLPKSLFPLNDKKESTLSLLLNNLAENNLNDVIIVGGYEIDKIRLEISKICPKSCNYVIVDANPDYQNGPIYSFLSATNELSNEEQFLLLPADSIFSSSIFKYIEDHNFSKNECHLFYYKTTTIPYSGSQCVLCDFSNYMSGLEEIVSLEKWKEIYLDKYNFYPVLVPAIILPTFFFEHAKKVLTSGVKDVIAALKSYCSIEKNCRAHLLSFNSNNWIFQDFDTPDDLEKIQSLIEK